MNSKQSVHLIANRRNVLKSNTGPNITARFEGKTEEDMEKIKDEFIGLIK